MDNIIDNILGYDKENRRVYASTFHNNRRAVVTKATMNNYTDDESLNSNGLKLVYI